MKFESRIKSRKEAGKQKKQPDKKALTDFSLSSIMTVEISMKTLALAKKKIYDFYVDLFLESVYKAFCVHTCKVMRAAKTLCRFTPPRIKMTQF